MTLTSKGLFNFSEEFSSTKPSVQSTQFDLFWTAMLSLRAFKNLFLGVYSSHQNVYDVWPSCGGARPEFR